LNSFDKQEVKIVAEDFSFEETKIMLQQRLDDLKSGNSALIAIENYKN
jgi:hypothetical protein